MMEETDAVTGKQAPDLREVGLHAVDLDVHQRIEAEDDVEVPRQHGERRAVVHVVADVRIGGEASSTRLNAPRAEINEAQVITDVLQILRPSAMARPDLEDARGRQPRVETERQRAEPLRLRVSPGRRPLLTVLIVAPVGLIPPVEVFMYGRHAGSLSHTAS